MKLKNKVAVITGGGKGIGEAIAIKLTSEGCAIVIADMDIDNASKVSDNINIDGKAIAVKTNVAEEKSVNAMIESSISLFGKIDILINNAGIRHLNNIVDHSKKEWDEMLRCLMPALLIKISIFPNRLIEDSIIALTLFSSATFVFTAIALPSIFILSETFEALSISISAITIAQPSLVSFIAIASPIPFPPPVITATLFLSFIIYNLLLPDYHSTTL
jgi:NAD(P)-dependent dehydrogenase (short-subunit alcohol dehydrogenase family)